MFAYDGVDRERQYTPPALPGIATPQTVYTYNLDKQLTNVLRPDGQTITLDYGAVTGLLDTMTIPAGLYSYGYDPVSAQLASITAPGGESLSYAYDGSLLTLSSATGTVTGSVARGYDNDFRIASRSVNGAQTITFGYDGDSLLTRAGDLVIAREAQRAGLIAGSTLGNVTTSRGYNGFAELDSFAASYDTTSLYSTSYTRDRLGRIEQKTETLAGITTITAYCYDLAGRLATETTGGVTTTWGYDTNGNRTHIDGTLVGTYDDQDRLNTYQAVSYTYSDNGELQAKAEAGLTTTYDYDVLGNLRSVALPGGMQIGYVIEGQNRRVGKKVDGTLVQGFLYKDQLNPVAELDGNNAVVSRFIYGTKINVPDYMIKNGNTYRIISDHLGSPRLVVDVADGTIAQRIDYDTWGNITLDTNPGFQPFGFAGGLYDQHTGLVRFGARDYDPVTGRWTSKDPIRFRSSGYNFYEYAATDPVSFIDRGGELPEFPQSVVNFSAGLGDSLLLGFGDNLREALGVSGGIDPCSDAYKTGGYAAFLAGGARLAYAGLAKGGSLLASSGASASSFRSGLRSTFRLGFGKNYRSPQLSKYKNDAELRAAAGRTNSRANAAGATAAAGGAIVTGQSICGCPQ